MISYGDITIGIIYSMKDISTKDAPIKQSISIIGSELAGTFVHFAKLGVRKYISDVSKLSIVSTVLSHFVSNTSQPDPLKNLGINRTARGIIRTMINVFGELIERD